MGNDFTAIDPISGLLKECCIVSVKAHEPLSVVDDQHQAEAAQPVGENYLAVRNREHRRLPRRVDLERIGDLAVNIAEKVEHLGNADDPPLPIDLSRITSLTQAMLRDALDALVNRDPNSARRVCAADDDVDDCHHEIAQRVEALLTETVDASAVTTLIHLLSVSRCLERIADLATNIAEDIIYMTEGDIVRHGHGT